MESIKLGKTGIEVSKLCFGTLTIGPLQKNFPLAKGTGILRAASELGVNFYDTAEIYDTYKYLKPVIKEYPKTVVATKCYAYDRKTAERSFAKAVKELGREWIDIFMLHEQESVHTLRGHAEALEYFMEKKEKGFIGALGISTHHIAGVIASTAHPLIEVIEAIINNKGWGIIDGTIADMEGALSRARTAGKGIIAMKPLGGGHLIQERERAFTYIRDLGCIDSIALGIQSEKEIKYAIAYLTGREREIKESEMPDIAARELIIEPWCTGCGHCMAVCQHEAIQVASKKAAVNRNRCVLCGYCGASCPQLAIKVV